MKRTPAVFLDRDGVINEILFHKELGLLETPFTVSQFKLKKGAARAIGQINRIGLKTVVVSNQPGIAMRHFSKNTLRKVTEKMCRELWAEKAYLDGIYYCIHHPEKGFGSLKKRCNCRKPKAGLFKQAAKDFNIDLKKSFMIGDSILDVQAGKAAGCKTFLLGHLKCDLCNFMGRKGIKPDYWVKDFPAAVKKIKGLAKNSKSSRSGSHVHTSSQAA